MKLLAVTPVLVVFALGCPAPEREPGPRTFNILHTADEHGAFNASESRGLGGAAHVQSRWLVDEDVSEETHLILSSGDSWMGPVESTYLEGEPTIAAMNAMGYRASAFGNHELDQGQGVLADRMDQAGFKFLAANAVVSAPSTLPVEGFELFTVGGVTVGVVGLAHQFTATALSLPEHAAGLGFTGYGEALNAAIPEARAAGAELIVVVVHDSLEEVEAGTADLGEGVDLWLGGHRHRVGIQELRGVPFVESGSRWERYTRIAVQLDASGAVQITPELVDVVTAEGPPPDAELVAAFAAVQAEVDVVFGEEIGFTDFPMRRGGLSQGAWVTGAWLAALPEVQVAVQNSGGLRAPLEVGPITLGDVADIMPFENTIVAFDITGAGLTAVLQPQLDGCVGEAFSCLPIVAGFNFEYDEVAQSVAVQLHDGSFLDDEAVYRVATNSFMFEGGSNWTWLDHATNVDDTGLHYSFPTLDATRSLSLEPNVSLFDEVDAAPRDQLSYRDPVGFVRERQLASSWGVVNLVVDAWHAADPGADLVIGCFEDVEHSLIEGPLLEGEIIGLYPFDDPLYLGEFTGAQLNEMLAGIATGCPLAPERCLPAIAGGTWDAAGGAPRAAIAGVPVADEDVVSVIVPEGLNGAFCGEGVPADVVLTELAGTSRQTLFDAVIGLATSEADPIDDHLDVVPRGSP